MKNKNKSRDLHSILSTTIHVSISIAGKKKITRSSRMRHFFMLMISTDERKLVEGFDKETCHKSSRNRPLLVISQQESVTHSDRSALCEARNEIQRAAVTACRPENKRHTHVSKPGWRRVVHDTTYMYLFSFSLVFSVFLWAYQAWLPLSRLLSVK